MNKILKNSGISLLALLLVLTGCKKSNNNSSSSSQSSSSSSESISINYDDIGGDETDDAPYIIKDGGVFTIDALPTGEDSFYEFITNPQKMPAANSATTSTTIYSVEITEAFVNRVFARDAKAILYTPDFYFTNTNATDDYVEVIASYNETSQAYVVTAIEENGGNYIPLDGIIFAIPKPNEEFDLNIENPFSVGDEIKFDSTMTVNRYQYAAVNQDNIRIPFNNINVYREANQAVVYTQEYGNFTKTNEYGAEIYVKYNFEKHSFEVTGFRGDNKVAGDLVTNHMEYGSKIPEYGFVISSHNGAPTYQAYREGRKFKTNDTIRLENFTLYPTNNETIFQKYSMDNPTTRPAGFISKYTPGSNVLDEYGYTNQNLYQALELAVVEIGEYGLVKAMDREVGCPDDGYILSCNGTVAENLKKVVRVGSVIKIEGNTIRVIEEVGLNQKVHLQYYENLLNSKFESGKNNLYDYDFTSLETNLKLVNTLKTEIETLKTEINNTTDETLKAENSMKIQQKFIEATRAYNYGYVAGTESPYVDGRAAWLWASNANSLEKVQQLITHYKNANINLIYLCVFDGTAYYQSELVPYNQAFVGNFGEYGENNFLGAFIGEAHKAGIEVHGWTTNFHVGTTGQTNELFNAHPEWQQVYYTGKVDSEDEMTELDLLYFDQANPEVQDFLIDFYDEMLSEYELDGLHIDYIRYAAGNDVGEPDSVYCPIAPGGFLYAENCLDRTQGYTQYAMEDFKKEYGFPADANVKELVKNVETYRKWSEYRTNKVTQFVNRLYDEVINEYDTIFSMAIVPEVEFAKANKMQDWTKWLNEGWMDMINGMYYSPDPNRTLIEHSKVEDLLKDKVYNYPGVLAASYYSLPAIENIYYYEAAHESSNMGASFFDANAIWDHQRTIWSDSNTDLETLLKLGTHRNEAVLPHSELKTIMEAFILNIEDRIDNLYMPNGAMNQAQKDALLAKLNEISLDDVNSALNSLVELKAQLSQYANEVASARISEYMDLMISLCKIKIARDF